MDVLQREMPMVMSSRANGDVGAFEPQTIPANLPARRPLAPVATSHWRQPGNPTGTGYPA
jgi:hypothetical protein